jgi:hypothetical protein
MIGLIATNFPLGEIGWLPVDAGSSADGRLKARSGTTESVAARRNKVVAISLLFLSRYDLLRAKRSATDKKNREVVDVTLPAPTLVNTKGTPTLRARIAQLKNAYG